VGVIEGKLPEETVDSLWKLIEESKKQPEDGQLIIWPSHVLHEVPKQLCDHERIMIAGDGLFDRWA
jgi:ABC-type Na+ transport system ATPase subunit NatA